MMSRIARHLGVVGVVLVLAGCASFPTSGPVQRASDARTAGVAPGIDVAAQPPDSGASPEAILDGFFSALESPGEGYAVARQYLTAEAAAAWDPESGVTIYDTTGQSTAVTDDDVAILRAPLAGRLDADGVFTAADEESLSHDFEMTQVDGEWRIGNPGDGVLMSVQRFRRAFRSVPVYYLDSAGERLVAQRVFLRQEDLASSSPDVLVRALLRDPGSWLRPAVLDVLPSEVHSLGTTVDEDGIAHVNLSAEAEALSANQRLQAAAQLLHTLRYFTAIQGIEIDVNGRTMSIPGADADGVVRTAAVAQFAPERHDADRDLYGISDGVVVRIAADQAFPAREPVAGPLGGTWSDRPGRVAVSWTDERFGVTSEDGRRLYTAGSEDAEPTLVYSGTSLVSPQFDTESALWAVDNTADGPVAVRVSTDGSVSVLPIGELAGAQVVAFRIGPDETHVAVVAQVGSEQRLGMLHLRGTDQLVLDGWRELPVNTSDGPVTRFRDVAFTTADRLMVLGTSDRYGQFTVYTLDIDASTVTSQGPMSDVDAVGITALVSSSTSTVAIVTSAHRGLRYEAQYRWPVFVEGVTDLAYPS
ncbi:MtrAB system accessory lipoprotein LpqB [Brooklawnia cerclae]|uniref:GerMN domain-containing protein n=1 Tax=Brooklawnia cerclae TaxID=349934 RepID=A0ABX0SD71_9ACTN|nr:LpqB family beta-propeller domain-containing protein [Brooklawnia cerclae]NIH56337.1 hypothetical protein [Brooklawnia cerclae]